MSRNLQTEVHELRKNVKRITSTYGADAHKGTKGFSARNASGPRLRSPEEARETFEHGTLEAPAAAKTTYGANTRIGEEQWIREANLTALRAQIQYSKSGSVNILVDFNSPHQSFYHQSRPWHCTDMLLEHNGLRNWSKRTGRG